MHAVFAPVKVKVAARAPVMAILSRGFLMASYLGGGSAKTLLLTFEFFTSMKRYQINATDPFHFFANINENQ